MYPVSEAFLNAVKANTRKYYWTGRITTRVSVVYNFEQDDMVKGSGYITSQCCGSTEIELGTVYAAEMGISLFSEINRYTLEDAKVELFYHMQVAGGSYETIPMGTFEISEANRKAKCLEIKAYDYITMEYLSRVLKDFDKIYYQMTDLEKKEFMRNFIESIEILPERTESGRILKHIDLRFPIYYEGNEGDQIRLLNEMNVETCVLLTHPFMSKS